MALINARLPHMFSRLIPLIVLMVGFSTTVDAGPLSDRKVIDTIDSEQLLEIVQSEGFQQAVVDEDGDIEFSIDGHLAYFILTEEKDFIYFQTWWTDVDLNESDTNAWNANAFFSRAYIDDEGDPILEVDMSLTGGVRVTALRNFIRVAAGQYQEFAATFF